MARITQYQPLAQVGPQSASFKERTTPDKYLPNEPKTFVRPAIAASALLATVTAFAFVPPVNAAKTWIERVQADKFYLEIGRPTKRFDLTRAQYSYYETRGGLFFVPFADGVKKNWQENPQADKWWQPPNQPQFDVKRAQHDTPSYFTADRQQVPGLDSWWQQASEYLRQPDRRILRNGDSQLTLTDAQTDEAVSVDRYWQQASETLRDVKRWQYLDQFHFAPDQQQVPDLDSWVPLANQAQFDRQRSQYLLARTEWTSTLTANRSFPDSWHPNVEQPQFDRKRTQFLVAKAEWVSTFVANRVFPDSWHPEVKAPQFDLRRTQFIDPSYFGPDRQSEPRLDSWWPLIAQPQFDLKRTQFLAGRTEWVSTFVANRVFPDSWHPETNKPQFDLKRLQALYPPFVGVDRQPQPRVDSWWQLPGQPQFDLRRSQYLPPNSVGPDRQPQSRVDSWWQQTSEYLRQPDRRVLRQGDSEIQLTPAQQTERTSVDRYDPGTQRPQFDKKRTQATYEFSFFYPQPLASPIFAERWHPASNLPIFPLDRRIQFFGDSELTLAANQRTERSTPDKWHPATEQRLRAIVGRLPENYPAPFTPRGIFVDSWWQQTNEQIRSTGSRRHLLEFFVSGTRDQERTTPDKYDSGIRQPLFDLARKQYLAQAFALPERQPEPRFNSWYQPLPERVQNQERRYIAPSAVHPERQPAGEIRLDWLLPAVERHERIRSVAPPAEAFVFSGRTITVDQWEPTLANPAHAARWISLGGSFAPDLQSVARLDSWFLETNAPQRTPARKAHGEIALPVTSVSETSVDEWQPLANQPLFDVARSQYLYQYQFSPESLFRLFPGSVHSHIASHFDALVSATLDQVAVRLGPSASLSISLRGTGISVWFTSGTVTSDIEPQS